MAKNIGGFLSGGYKGSNAKPIYPGGKGIGKPSTGGLNKKISAKQVPLKDTGKVAGGPNYPAKSEHARNTDIYSKAIRMKFK